MSLFVFSKNNLIDDMTYQNALTSFVSPEWHSLLNEIRNRALSNHYLIKTMEAYQVSKEEDLFRALTPLCENENYLKSFSYASENRKEQMLVIQYNQAEEFLKKCIREKRCFL